MILSQNNCQRKIACFLSNEGKICKRWSNDCPLVLESGLGFLWRNWGKPEVKMSDLVKVQQSKMLNLIQSLDHEIQWRPSMVPSFVNQLLTFPILVVGHSGNNRFYPILSQSGVVSKTEILQWNCFTFVKAKKRKLWWVDWLSAWCCSIIHPIIWEGSSIPH